MAPARALTIAVISAAAWPKRTSVVASGSFSWSTSRDPAAKRSRDAVMVLFRAPLVEAALEALSQRHHHRFDHRASVSSSRRKWGSSFGRARSGSSQHLLPKLEEAERGDRAAPRRERAGGGGEEERLALIRARHHLLDEVVGRLDGATACTQHNPVRGAHAVLGVLQAVLDRRVHRRRVCPLVDRHRRVGTGASVGGDVRLPAVPSPPSVPSGTSGKRWSASVNNASTPTSALPPSPSHRPTTCRCRPPSVLLPSGTARRDRAERVDVVREFAGDRRSQLALLLCRRMEGAVEGEVRL